MASRPRRPPTAAELVDHGRAVRAAIHAVARRIPRGKIATYGQLAELAGYPGGARVAGAAMKTSTPEDRLPWHRVVGKRGGSGVIAIHDPVGAAVQRGLLEDEGVIVGAAGTIALARFGWLPTDRPTSARGRAATAPAGAGSRRRSAGRARRRPRRP